MKVMTAFEKINFRIPKSADGQQIALNSENEIIGHLVNGVIEKRNEKVLDRVEKLLNQFFKSMFSDVVKAFYKKSNRKDVKDE